VSRKLARSSRTRFVFFPLNLAKSTAITGIGVAKDALSASAPTLVKKFPQGLVTLGAQRLNDNLLSLVLPLLRLFFPRSFWFFGVAERKRCYARNFFTKRGRKLEVSIVLTQVA
jgi:hypothetical protein